MDDHHDIDPALLAEFIDESIDFLSEIDNLFVQLEAEPSNLSTVESIFRPIHSIKGNSSFFGFVGVKTLSHEMETLLDMVRKGSLSVTQSLISVLLEGVDELKVLLTRCRQGDDEIEDEERFNALLERVIAEGSGGDRLGSTCARILEGLDKLRPFVEPLGTEPMGHFDEILTDVRSLIMDPGAEASDGGANGARHPWPQELREIMRILNEPLPDLLPEDKSRAVGDALTALKNSAANDTVRDGVEEAIEDYVTFTSSLGFDALLQEIIVSKLREIDSPESWIIEETEAEPTPMAQAPAEPAASGTRTRPAAEPQKTMRIPESNIDTFLSYVGELLVVGDMFNHLQLHVAEHVADQTFISSFKLATDTFDSLSDDLQKSIMTIRKVAVNALFQKVPRIVRDIASANSKQIDVVMKGEEIQVDKSLIDLLDAPLTHMVRNAGDHGIEKPEVRVSRGKDPKGTIVISCEEEASNISLIVEDDGGGLNLNAIRAKAESLRLIEKGGELSSDEIVEFMFRSGVSTAETITDVSGRGVGMDVVKRMIEEAGGHISVSTEEGKGSRFQIVLPKTVTTQIMQGFLVECDGQCFVLPMSKVQETSEVEPGSITELPGFDKCVRRHGQILPLLSLRQALDRSRDGLTASGNGAIATERLLEKIMITVAAREGSFGMSVDAVLGVQKVVFREICGLDSGTESIVGGALMGDGKVSLILDVDKLYEEYHSLN